jgi:predicted O-methyltransferase YrrM
MSQSTPGFKPALSKYLNSISPPEATILSQLRQETAALPASLMQISPGQGQFLGLLIQILRPERVLEIGVFRGYSSLAMALYLPPQGQLIACDLDARATAIAERYWQQAGVRDKIQLRLAPALETLTELIAQGQAGSFDLVFIDADKRLYEQYYEMALQLLRPGGLMAIDNIFWQGRLWREADHSPRTEAMRRFNQKLRHDQRIYLSILPLGDGMSLALKRGDIS